jgi:hypothetical protein
MAQTKKFRMFDTARLRFEQLREDISNYIVAMYNENNANLNMASPLMQVLYVVANLGRMILFYIESAMTETNISTAVHDRSIKAISTLTGHNPSRGMAARGTVKLQYNMKTEYYGQTINISNYTKIRSDYNGLTYLLTLPGDFIQCTIGNTNEIECPIVQGELHYQQATGYGVGMQSFNFPAGTYEIIDDFFVNVYVNGERWKTVESFVDMSYDEKACVVKTSANNGIDIFFGNRTNGAIPEYGATIRVEYLVCSGSRGNIGFGKDEEIGKWSFVDNAVLLDGTTLDLNDIFVISPSTDIMFGSDGEDVTMTRVLAPHASRSFVLANGINYEYFLRRLNMFSIIDTIQGFDTFEDNQAELAYSIAESEYIKAREDYYNQVTITGANSTVAKEKYDTYLNAQNQLDKAKNVLSNSKMDDNVVYLFLVPDLSTRIDDTNNYFTCSVDSFKLSDKEKENIISLLDNSGQKILTVENQILDPKMPKFAMNIFVQIWSTFDFDTVKSSMITAVSNYLLGMTRRDKIPVSDIISILDNVEGVDSVSVYFDADKNNDAYYGEGNYGIDPYGDITLERTMTDVLGNSLVVKDLLPIFRGPFTSNKGIEYSDDINSLCSPINITLRGKTDIAMSNKLNIVK